MFKIKSLAILAILALSLSGCASNENLGAGATLRVAQGGTSANYFTAGECLIGNGTGAITTAECGSGASGGSSVWSTSTDGVLYYNGSRDFVVGDNTTTTDDNFQVIGGLYGDEVTTPSLSINGETFTDLTGTGLSNVGGVLTASGGTGDLVSTNNLSDVSAPVLAAHNLFDDSIFAETTVVPNDKVLIKDVSGSNVLKTVTAQSIADLAGASMTALPEGQIYVGNDSDVAEANDIITVDTTDEYVGIANPSPAYDLDVGGNINITGAYNVNGTPLNISSWDTAYGWGDHAVAGYVVGPASATDNNFAAFDSTTGELIKDSGYSFSDFTEAWSEENILYVSKSGDNSNDGSNESKAFLTISAAITKAISLTPASDNRIEIRVGDASSYTENLTIPSWVGVVGASCEIIGNHIVADNSLLRSYRLITNSGVSVLKSAGTGTAKVVVERMNLTSTAVGIVCTAGSISYSGSEITLVNGIGVASVTTGQVDISVTRIYITGTGFGVSLLASGHVTITANEIVGTGAGTGIYITSGGRVDANLANINTSVAYNVASGCTLNLVCSSLSGTKTNAGTTNYVTTNNGANILGNISVSGAFIGALTGTASGNLTSSDINTYSELNTIVADQTLAYSGGAFHDGFSDYVANEHIDWTTDQGAININAGNYTDTNTTYTAGGTLLDLTGTVFSINEGTLTDTKLCTYETGTGIQCITDVAAGDVESVGNCTGGACFDGTSDGGTNLTFYDGDSHTGQLSTTNLTGGRSYLLPDISGLLVTNTIQTLSSLSTVGTIGTGIWQGTDIDISDYTNLVAGTNISLSGDTLNVDDAFIKNSTSDTMTGTLTADGLTLGANENITLGSQTIDHDGTDFNFNDSVDINNGTHGLRIVPGASTTTIEFY